MWLAVEKRLMDGIGKCKGRQGKMKQRKKEEGRTGWRKRRRNKSRSWGGVPTFIYKYGTADRFLIVNY